jgi:hypothetical protein
MTTVTSENYVEGLHEDLYFVVSRLMVVFHIVAEFMPYELKVPLLQSTCCQLSSDT